MRFSWTGVGGRGWVGVGLVECRTPYYLRWIRAEPPSLSSFAPTDKILLSCLFPLNSFRPVTCDNCFITEVSCPIGEFLADHNCTNCPWETHHCHSFVMSGFTGSMCCPNGQFWSFLVVDQFWCPIEVFLSSIWRMISCIFLGSWRFWCSIEMLPNSHFWFFYVQLFDLALYVLFFISACPSSQPIREGGQCYAGELHSCRRYSF